MSVDLETQVFGLHPGAAGIHAERGVLIGHLLHTHQYLHGRLMWDKVREEPPTIFIIGQVLQD